MDEGGEPACWLDRVCPECGRLRERSGPGPCENCGANRGENGGANDGGANDGAQKSGHDREGGHDRSGPAAPTARQGWTPAGLNRQG
ncbi:hypothetical protein [Kitasatospora sp. NPDC001547]|uniref:hypothetical protein n=1 Tax=Kitasatospora sp. NPDC001547 TaxID=3364015 RepID=UPI0036A00847